ncbi:polysaccharide biosynthesis C-terminal domain-containing protein [Microbacterium karelineae]|uniref:polysaccharide biosynthesis C-terminal domain-containing protein n=1 Tax=Microbacterium karelineae TaxID=2654283 RepID=UPI0012EA9084|nr:polysaccharide biosynthesis C-terminal domain-containing protein [Microbacterium karelineae]
MSLTRRLLSFSTIPAFSALIPFLILPLLARAAGEQAWVAIAVGQSVGGFLALAVGLGLNVQGPTLVALAAEEERPELFARGTRARLMLVIPALVIGSAVAWILAPAGAAGDAALMAVAITLGGLTSSWYLIGLGRPLPLIGYELLPRAIATLIGAVLVVVGGAAWVWTYPTLLITAILGGVGAYALRVVPVRELMTGWASSMRFARRQLSAAATETVSGAYTALAVSLVTAGASTAQAATYVSGDKLWRMGQTVTGAQGNALQGWVVEEDRAHFGWRARRALALHIALGVAGFLMFALLGPWLTAVAFGSDVAIDQPTAILFGVAVLCMSMSTATGRHVLIALGHPKRVFASVVAGAVVGIPTTLALASAFGAVGGAAGLATAETVVLVVQVAMIVPLWSARRARA